MRAAIPLAVLVALFVPRAFAGPKLTPDQALAREIYEELVEIDTTAEHGSTTRAAEAVAKRLRAAGFSADDVRVLAPADNKGNLVARLRAPSAAEKPLLLLAHLDVVEAKREDWSVDPWTLLEQDDFFYGRGTSDDKAMAAIFTANLIRMRREGTPLRRDVILALTADEEGGPDNGVEWLLREHRPLVEAALVINEGGGGRIKGGKYLLNGIQASEKTYRDFALEVRNKGGHSSIPAKDNAIYRLAAGLIRLEAHTFPVELTEVTRAYLERVAPLEDAETAAAMRALAKNPRDAAAAGRLSERPTYNAMLRTTCVATRVEAGHANNALPQLARAIVNCRIMPDRSTDEVRAELARVVADPALEVRETETPSFPAPASPLTPEVMGAVEKVTAEMWPGLPVVPTMSSGATDSRYFRSAGVPAYGVSGIFHDVDDIRAHGRDERLGVPQFYEGQEFLRRLVLELAAKR